MSPELLELLMRMGISDAFANDQILGRDPAAFQQGQDRAEQKTMIQQGSGRDVADNPTLVFMDALIQEGMRQGLFNPPPPPEPSPLDRIGEMFGQLMQGAQGIVGKKPDRSQSGTLEQIIADVLNGTKARGNPDDTRPQAPNTRK